MMMLWGVGDAYHVDSLADYAPVIDILTGKAVSHGITEIAQNVVFYVTFNAIGDLSQ